MNVLITGGSGLLGRYLLKGAPQKYAIVGTYRRHSYQSKHVIAWMGLTASADMDILLNTLKPEIVIHCAGVGDVDRCEKDTWGTRMANVVGTLDLCKFAAYQGVKKFVYLSTNAVFKGDDAPYCEKDGADPVNEYGRQKAEAERVVKQTFGDKALIIRPILLYGWPREGGRQNWATRIYDALKNDEPQRIVNDRVTQPTYAADVARVIWSLIGKGASGIYHVGGLDICTLYSFARKVAQVFGLDESLISPAVSTDFPAIAPRPVNTTYSLRKLWSSGIVPPGGIEDGLAQMRDETIYVRR